jgi:hypothetical protein
MRKFIILPLMAAFAFGVAACGESTPSEAPAIEIEDCDAEDFANREAECGFSESKSKKKSKKVIKVKRKRR